MQAYKDKLRGHCSEPRHPREEGGAPGNRPRQTTSTLAKTCPHAGRDPLTRDSRSSLPLPTPSRTQNFMKQNPKQASNKPRVPLVTHIYTPIHRYTHKHTHPYSHNVHIHKCSHSHTYKHHMHTYIQPLTHSHVYTQPHIHTFSHTFTHVYTHAHMFIPSLTCS